MAGSESADMKSTLGLIVRRGWGALGLLLALAISAMAQERVVAIGDVHGAFPQFVRILQRTGLIDASHQWTGGSAILVQAGDVPSRGTRTRECLDLLMELERQAAKDGGRVISLLGNHEVMVMMGDLRYVSREDYRAFATKRSEEVRDRAYKEYVRFLAECYRRRPSAAGNRPSRETWMAEHPLGFFEYRDAFGPGGAYGRWLRKHDTVAQVGDVLFLHGGLNPELEFRSVRNLNNHIRSELGRFDFLWRSLSEKKIIWHSMRLEEAIREVQEELAAITSLEEASDQDTMREMQELLSLQRWMMVSPDGPLWYRGYAWEPEEKLAQGLEEMMSRMKVERIVAAHTITDSRRITSRFDNRVFLIDTGMMLEGRRQGLASALEIEHGRFTAHYSNGEQQVLLVSEGGGTAPALGHGRSNGKQEP